MIKDFTYSFHELRLIPEQFAELCEFWRKDLMKLNFIMK